MPSKAWPAEHTLATRGWGARPGAWTTQVCCGLSLSPAKFRANPELPPRPQGLSGWELIHFRWTAGRAGHHRGVCKDGLPWLQGHTSRKGSQCKRRKRRKCACFILLPPKPTLETFLMLPSYESRLQAPWVAVPCPQEGRARIKTTPFSRHVWALGTSDFHSSFPLTRPEAGTR